MIAVVNSVPKIENLKEPERNMLYRQLYSILLCFDNSTDIEMLKECLAAYREKVCFHNETHHFYWLMEGDLFVVRQRGNKRRIIFTSKGTKA
jgi:hypothetical protein